MPIGNEKYRLTFDDIHEVEWIVSFYPNGYASTKTDLIGSGNPLSFRETKSAEKIVQIVGKTARISFRASTEGQYAADFEGIEEDQVEVIITRAGSTFFHGFVMPDLFTEEYIDPKYAVTVTASDGLGRLSGIDFTIPGTPRQTFLETIWDCLAQTNLQDDLWEACDVYETNGMVADLNASPLNQAFHNANNFQDSEGAPIDCREVLVRTLQPFEPVRLFQESGAWNIVPLALMNGTYTRRKFLYNTINIDSTESGHDRQVTTDANFKITASESYRFPAFKKQKITVDLGPPTSLIPDGLFEAAAWTNATTLRKFTNTGLTISQFNSGSSTSSKYSVKIETVTAGTTVDTTKHLESSPVAISDGSGGTTNNLTIRFDYLVSTLSNNSTTRPRINLEIRIEPHDASATQYLQSDLTWTTASATQIQYEVEVYNSWQGVILNNEAGQWLTIPIAGDLYVKLFPFNAAGPGLNFGAFDRVVALLANENTLPTEFEFFEGVHTENFTYIAPERTHYFGDVSQFAGQDLGPGQRAKLTFRVDSLIPGDSISMDLNTVTQQYQAVASSPTGNQFDDVVSLKLAITTDAGSDYTVTSSTPTGPFPTTFTVTANSYDSNLDLNASEIGTSIVIVSDDINIDPVAGDAETALGRGSITLPGGEVSQTWARRGTVETLPITRIALQRILDQHQRESRIISCNIPQLTGHPYWGMIIKDQARTSYQFIGYGLNFNARESIWTGEIIESISSTSTPTITQTDREQVIDSAPSAGGFANVGNDVVAPGEDEMIIYNDNGNFAADANLKWDDGGQKLEITGDIVLDDGKGILDDSENGQLTFGKTASAVNYFRMTNAAAGSSADLSTVGSDTNIGINVSPKGTGKIGLIQDVVYLGGSSLAGGRTIQALSSDANASIIIQPKGSSAIVLLQDTVNLGGSSLAGDRTVSVLSSDTNSSIKFQPKGSGSVNSEANTTNLGASSLAGAKTLQIISSDTNADIIILPKGTGVISVSGTTTYENNVTADDDIPNKKYVDVEYAELSFSDAPGDSLSAVGGTVDVWYKVFRSGNETNSGSSDMSLSTGRITYTGTATKKFMFWGSISIVKNTAGDIIYMRLAKNGVPTGHADYEIPLKNSISNAQGSVTQVFSLATNDYVEMYVLNNTDGGTMGKLSVNITCMEIKGQ